MVRLRPDDIAVVQAVERETGSGAIRVIHPHEGLTPESAEVPEGPWYAVFEADSWWPVSDG